MSAVQAIGHNKHGPQDVVWEKMYQDGDQEVDPDAPDMGLVSTRLTSRMTNRDRLGGSLRRDDLSF